VAVAVGEGAGVGEADGSAVESSGEANVTDPEADGAALGDDAGPPRIPGSCHSRAAASPTPRTARAARGMCGALLTTRYIQP
jgi:hypothetical protein